MVFVFVHMMYITASDLTYLIHSGYQYCLDRESSMRFFATVLLAAAVGAGIGTELRINCFPHHTLAFTVVNCSINCRRLRSLSLAVRQTLVKYGQYARNHQLVSAECCAIGIALHAARALRDAD